MTKLIISFFPFVGATLASVIDLPLLSVTILEHPVYDITKVLIGGSVPILIREYIAHRTRKSKEGKNE